MGRPPLATKMTRTEIQRRWRKRRRLGLVGRPPKTVPPDERPAVPPADLAWIEQLTRERDQARREIETLKLELVVGIEPGAAEPDDPGRCFYCLKRRDEVKAMLNRGVGSRCSAAMNASTGCARSPTRSSPEERNGARPPWIVRFGHFTAVQAVLARCRSCYFG
jgi:hypothetical protein